jgi:hypothetical protein
MTLRRLTTAGLARLSDFLDSLNTNVPKAVPSNLLEDAEASTALNVDVDIEQRTFETRFDLARYLDSKLTASGLVEIVQDIGLWAWLALYYFDQLCPRDESGRRRAGERAKWIPAVDDYRKYYRHLVAGPYRIYRAHYDNPLRAFAALAGPPDRPGEIAEQLASRQEIVTNKTAMELATLMYIDRKSHRPKRGAAGSGPGSARRLADVLNQYELTWDLYALDTLTLLNLMPAEFDRFRPSLSQSRLGPLARLEPKPPVARAASGSLKPHD